MRHGRPLRFLALTLGGWTLARIVLLWPTADEQPAVQIAEAAPPIVAAPLSTLVRGQVTKAVPPHPSSYRRATATGVPSSRPAAGERRPGVAQASPVASIISQGIATNVPAPNLSPAQLSSPGYPLSALPTIIPIANRPRLAGSTWLIARPNGGDDLSFGQLGASQAGVRVTYAIDRARSVALSARLSAPLSGRGREAALGLDWRPTALPVSLLVEERLPLDGGPPRPAAQLIGGLTKRLPLGVQIESYAQVGAVYRRGGFADGAARIARPLLASHDVTVDIGAGGWGAAQRGAARLDVGPTIGVALPARVRSVGGSVRLGLDYRFRVAGRARPGSGPAVTLGTSF